MDFKADVDGLTFVATGEVSPVIDYETKAQRANRDGAPLWGVRVLVASTEADAGRSELITVKVAGTRPEVAAGVPVRVVGLRLTPWSRGDAGGVGFRAERIEPATGPTMPARPASSAGAAGSGAAGRRGGDG